jgi:hypothetical protein
MPNPDLSLIATSFVQFGGQVFGKKVLSWKLRELGIQVRTNVRAPQTLTKLSAVGGPRPYRSQDDTTGNGVKYTDRILTAYNSKWDHDFDAEEFRNTYLNMGVTDMSFAQAANEQLAKEYLDSIMRNTLYLGVRDGAGDAAVDICNGWGTILATEITATNIVPVATGAISSSNAVEKVEEVVQSAVGDKAWMRDEQGIVYCSYGMFDKYKTRYRALNGFQFQPGVLGDYKLDNLNAVLRPVPFMGSSDRLIYTLPNNLVFGTDVENIQVAASVRRNIIESRPMMSAGCEFQDLEAMIVNDQA